MHIEYPLLLKQLCYVRNNSNCHIFNSIHYRNKTGINTVLKLRSNTQYVPIVFPALIISLKLSEHKKYNIHLTCNATTGIEHGRLIAVIVSPESIAETRQPIVLVRAESLEVVEKKFSE